MDFWRLKGALNGEEPRACAWRRHGDKCTLCCSDVHYAADINRGCTSHGNPGDRGRQLCVNYFSIGSNEKY